MSTEKKRIRKSTKTSKFGVSARLNHDSSNFYDSRLYNDLKIKDTVSVKIERKVPAAVVNKIFVKSSENMEELPDNSVHLMITSPPYNVGKEYDQDLSLKEYNLLLERVMKDVYRVLVPGGRACVNIANVGRKPYLPLHADIIKIMQKLGFLMRGEIIWDKGASAGTSTAWGSWKSASNPTLRDTHEYILVFSKEDFKRNKKDKINTISKEEFMGFTKSVWSFPAVSAKRVGHPAPFPEELPRRLIEFYSFKDDIILDPFMGSGQTAIAAIKSSRKYVGYDIDETYCELAEKRIKEVESQTKLN